MHEATSNADVFACRASHGRGCYEKSIVKREHAVWQLFIHKKVWWLGSNDAETPEKGDERRARQRRDQGGPAIMASGLSYYPCPAGWAHNRTCPSGGAGEREPDGPPTLRLRAGCPSHNTGRPHRAALKMLKGESESKNGGPHAGEGTLKTKPSSAAVIRPVRIRHHSTRKRRASATAICLARLPLAERSFSRAQMTPRYSRWNLKRRQASAQNRVFRTQYCVLVQRRKTQQKLEGRADQLSGERAKGRRHGALHLRGGLESVFQPRQTAR